MAREADLARFNHETGPATANSYTISVNPKDLTVDHQELEQTIEAEIWEYTIEEGLRLEGPVRIRIETDPEVASGAVVCHVEVDPGPPVPWAKLVSEDGTVEIGRTRALVGRAPDVDVLLDHEDISRRHAIIWQQGGQAWIRDLGSSNGTSADGSRVGAEPVPIETGSAVTMASHLYRFIVI